MKAIDYLIGICLGATVAGILCLSNDVFKIESTVMVYFVACTVSVAIYYALNLHKKIK